MALHLHVDRNLETLADRLAAFLSEQPADPFQPELVLVPSAGIRTWLTHGLATRLGVTAHIEFAFPVLSSNGRSTPTSNLASGPPTV